jgi:hypothetical protein
VAQDEKSELNEKLQKLYVEFCDGAPIMTRRVLLDLCMKCSLLDKNLAEADVDLVFQRVKVGKNPGNPTRIFVRMRTPLISSLFAGLKFVRFEEAMRMMAQHKSTPYYDLVKFALR